MKQDLWIIQINFNLDSRRISMQKEKVNQTSSDKRWAMMVMNPMETNP